MSFLFQVLAVFILIGILGGPFLIIQGIINGESLFTSVGLVMLLVSIGSIVLFFLISIGDMKKREKDEDEYCEYFGYSKELVLHKLSRKNKKYIAIKPVKSFKLEYHPSETIYTGATVGGIHTGGFHTTEAYYSPKVFFTGKYQLVFKNPHDKDNAGHIKKIELDHDLVNMCDQRVLKYKLGNKLILSHHEKSSDFEKGVTSFMKQGDSSKAYSMLKQAYLSEQLTYKECRAIYRWLCGK